MKSYEQLRGNEVHPYSISWVGSSTAAPEVVSGVPAPFNPTAMSRREGHPVIRSPRQLRLHPALEEIGCAGLTDEFNEAARLKDHFVPEPVLITTNGTILVGFGRWQSALFDDRREINCIEYPLSEEEALQFIISHHQPQRAWNAFVRIRLALKLEPYFQKKALDKARVSAEYGVRAGVIAILHTFNGKLEFNSHVHTMVTGGGLHGSSNTWVTSVYYNRDALMEAWRKAVIALLRAGLRAGQLRTDLATDQLEDLLTHLEKCWWSTKIQSFKNKVHFLQYAGRYVRRPPIAQRRITWIGKRTVRFWYKDKKLRRRVYVQCSLEEFIDRWSQHIQERYQHGVRNFGLFAPRALRHTLAAVFVILRQEQRPRPKPRPWADSIKRDFGHDPLLDRTGKRMKWVRRLKPKASR